MARAGAFDGVDAAMMVHPADADLISHGLHRHPGAGGAVPRQAAHAAAAPWEGRNALDAAVLGYMNVAALRQHIRPNERIHGIFTKAGDKPNIVPSRGGDGLVRPLRHHRVAAAAEAARVHLPRERLPPRAAAR